MIKQLLFIMLLLLPASVLAQSKANRYYKQGEKLLSQEKFKEAVIFFKKSDSLEKSTLSALSPNYYRSELKIAECFVQIADDYDTKGNYSEALINETKAMEIRKRILGEDNQEYAESLGNMSYYYDAIGNYGEAIRLAIKTEIIRKKVLGEEHPDYVSALSNLAYYYQKVGNYTEDIKIGNKALQIWEKVLGDNDPQYAIGLNNLAFYNSKLRNYEEAIRLNSKALSIWEISLGKDHINCAFAIRNIASYNAQLGNYQEALNLAAVAVEIMRNNVGEEHPQYASFLNDIAYYYYVNDNISDALKYGTMAMELWKKVAGIKHPHYAIALDNLAIYYAKDGCYEDAIKLSTESLQLLKDVFGDYHPEIATTLWNLSKFYFLSGDYTTSADYYKQTFNFINNNVLHYFKLLTANERAIFWTKFSLFYFHDILVIANICPDPSFSSIAYDAQIFSKGLLLNTEVEIQKLIEQSNDTSVSALFYQIKQKYELLDDLYQTPIEQRQFDCDSLAKAIETEERLLVESIKQLGDFTKHLKVDWKDVQNNLKENDLAVEFALSKDSLKRKLYVALILKKDMTSPEIVSLFSADTLLNFSINDLYSSPKLYNVLWKPLEKYFQGVKNVYFSPSAKLHTIGIEYLPDDEGKVFCEKYAAYRLSSTRELAVAHVINSNRKAATYGGIRYNNDSEIGDDRGGVASYLVGTKVESDSVANLLRSAHYNVVAFNDSSATEDSFKKLSGSGLSILHIGTHGFYFTEDEMQNIGLNLLVDNEQSAEDRSLSCSGLLLAGANAAFVPELRQSIPEGVGDGILPAKEISRLDFQGLDLVVLSACQSGLGEVTGEGVFGLQRGFKKAGARTLVMSLWNVSDEATQLLMTEFFKNFTSGMTKREAFVSAQKVVRQKFPHPGLWAAFVMVDGI